MFYYDKKKLQMYTTYIYILKILKTFFHVQHFSQQKEVIGHLVMVNWMTRV